MKLPSGDKAIVTDDKLIGYVLNEDHPVHGGHAVLFKRLLDIDRNNADVLKKVLLDAARENEAIAGKESAYGEKYEVRIEMSGDQKSYTILSVWIVESDSGVPRLVTAFVE